MVRRGDVGVRLARSSRPTTARRGSEEKAMHSETADGFRSTTTARLAAVWARVSAWLRRTDLGRLPRHVVRRIAEQDRANEILIGWVQDGLVAIFAELYFPE